MKIMPVLVSAVLLLGAVSCKSHKATVVRPSGHGSKTERPAVSIKGDVASDPSLSNDPKISDALVSTARTWLGTPYRYGGQTKKGTDCSGMLMVIYKDVANLSLPRNSAEQRNYCLDINRRSLQPGDLVFFSSSTRGGKVSHVGMYVGGGKIIHASSSRGVIESSLDEKYYKNHYHSSGRVYGITYAATGGKKRKDYIPVEVEIAAVPPDNAKPSATVNSSGKSDQKKNDGVVEMTLDQFVAMRQKPQMTDTVIVAEQIISRTAEVIDSASATVDSVRIESVPDSLPAERTVPEIPVNNIKGPTVIVNGERVEARPVEQKPVQRPDSLPADSVRQGREIRESVVKAMKFGKTTK